MVRRRPPPPRDRISNLPDVALETILMCLPIQDAARTSILSRQWRYRWAKLPQLILDKTLTDKMKHSARMTLAVVLCQIIFLHEGPINKFTLYVPYKINCPEIDNLIYFLSRNGIEDLTLEFEINNYKLPFSLFTCKKLRHLSLESCIIPTARAFEGFNKLTTLKLTEVDFSEDFLATLISASPLLEVLELQIYYSHDLEIEAPNLKSFKFIGIANSIILKTVPLIVSVSIIPLAPYDVKSGIYFTQGGNCKFDDYFCRVPFLEKLQCGNIFVKNLGAGLCSILLRTFRGEPEKITTLAYLKEVDLFDIILRSKNEISFIFCLIRNSPRLKIIDITLSNEVVDGSQQNCILYHSLLMKEKKSDFMYNELKEVKLKNVIGKRVELRFIEVLLAKSPSLQKMFIRLGEVTGGEGYEILKEVTKFRRASKEAEVIYLDR